MKFRNIFRKRKLSIIEISESEQLCSEPLFTQKFRIDSPECFEALREMEESRARR